MVNNDVYIPEFGGQQAADWLPRFSAACLRISESDDFSAVLQEVIANACWLTGARRGAVATLSDSGGVAELKTYGFTPEERRQLGELHKGVDLLGRSSEVEEPEIPVGITNHTRSVGPSRNHPPVKTSLGAALRYQGEILGNIYLAEKESGGEFGGEDEQLLAAFAAHAALAIANARIRRQEQRARADLEALINISPIGVLVFDAKTGELISVNDETRRLAGRLDAPDLTRSQFLEAMSCRTPDGRAIPVEELPPAKALRNGETVIADEVVIHLPNGLSITTLVNARPMYGDDGRVASIVCTIQDITRLEEIKKQRTEFLSRVNHEMRTPLAAIKGSVATMLGSPHPLDAAESRQFLRLVDEQADQIRYLIGDLADMVRIESGTLSITPEPTDLESLAERTRDSFLHSSAGSRVRLDLAADLPRIMADAGRIVQVLSTFLEEASRRSPEASPITVSASRQELYVAVAVAANGSDGSAGRSSHQFKKRSRAHDGNGPDQAEVECPSFAICRGIVDAHGGRMSVETGGPDGDIRLGFTVPIVDEVEYRGGNGAAPSRARSPSPAAEQPRILVVDGDLEVCRYIRAIVSKAGFTPVVTGNPDDLELLVEREKPHLALVELLLPWTAGFELMERIRKVSDAPVIFLSGHGSGENIERAFELGAADYIAKPFTPTELLARIKAALRRPPGPVHQDAPEPFVLGDLTIDYGERLVSVSGRQVSLTATEYKLLYELSTAAGRVLTHEQLLRLVWGPLYSGDTQITHTYVKQLRSKLGDAARRPTYIFTQPRVGYYMAKPGGRMEALKPGV